MAIRFRRRHLAVAALAPVVAGLVSHPLARAAASFESEPVEPGRAIALAQPLSGDRWNFLVLEQIEAAPPCWRRFEDGTVTTYEQNLPATTCGRYLSSSAYSLRMAGDDLRHPWRLRVESRGGRLELLASSPDQPSPLLVGTGEPRGAGLVELQLADGWSFERRQFQGRSLSHLYVAHPEPLPVLLARANAGGGPLLGRATPPPPPPLSPIASATSRVSAGGASRRGLTDTPAAARGSSRLSRLENLRLNRSRERFLPQEGDQTAANGVIALQVVPYRP